MSSSRYVLASSLEIRNAAVTEENMGNSVVSCSVSIIRSTFKLAEPLSQQSNVPAGSLPLRTDLAANAAEIENYPRLDLYLTAQTLPPLQTSKIYNNTVHEHIVTRTISFQRPLTRADHNGTITCQVESNNNRDVYLVKSVPVNIQCERRLEFV